MFSLSGQALAAASASSSAGVDASVTMRCPCSIQSAAPAIATKITTPSSFKAKLCVLYRTMPPPLPSLRMEPPLPEIVDQIRDRQDRQQPHQDQWNPPGHTFGKQRGQEADHSRSDDRRRSPAVPVHGRPLAAPARLPAPADAIGGRVEGEQRPIELEAEQVNHGAGDGERDGESSDLGR